MNPIVMFWYGVIVGAVVGGLIMTVFCSAIMAHIIIKQAEKEDKEKIEAQRHAEELAEAKQLIDSMMKGNQ